MPFTNFAALVAVTLFVTGASVATIAKADASPRGPTAGSMIEAADRGAQTVYSYDSSAVIGFISADRVKAACKTAADQAYDKGIKLCENLNGTLQSVGRRRIVVEGPNCTVLITFNCITDLN